MKKPLVRGAFFRRVAAAPYPAYMFELVVGRVSVSATRLFQTAENVKGTLVRQKIAEAFHRSRVDAQGCAERVRVTGM